MGEISLKNPCGCGSVAVLLWLREEGKAGVIEMFDPTLRRLGRILGIAVQIDTRLILWRKCQHRVFINIKVVATYSDGY
jgi:hypothetical protein